VDEENRLKTEENPKRIITFESRYRDRRKEAMVTNLS
jgi:hypothetical protein